MDPPLLSCVKYDRLSGSEAPYFLIFITAVSPDKLIPVNVLSNFRHIFNCIFEIPFDIVTVAYRTHLGPKYKKVWYLSFVKSTVLDPDRLETDTPVPRSDPLICQTLKIVPDPVEKTSDLL